MVRNPFEKCKVELELSVADLGILLSCLRRSLPEGRVEEQAVIDLSVQLIAKLEELKNS